MPLIGVDICRVRAIVSCVLLLMIWMMVWMGVYAPTVGTPFNFRDPVGVLNNSRAVLPFLACGLSLIVIRWNTKDINFKIWAIPGLIFFYALIGLIANFRSPDFYYSMSMGGLYITVPLVLYALSLGSDSITKIRWIILCNIGILFVVVISLIGYALFYMDLGSVISKPWLLLECHNIGSWFITTAGVLRSTGVGRFAGLVALIFLVYIFCSKSKSHAFLWCIPFLIVLSLLLTTGARTAFVSFVIAVLATIFFFLGRKIRLWATLALFLVVPLIWAVGLPQMVLKNCVLRGYDVSGISYLKIKSPSAEVIDSSRTALMVEGVSDKTYPDHMVAENMSDAPYKELSELNIDVPNSGDAVSSEAEMPLNNYDFNSDDKDVQSSITLMDSAEITGLNDATRITGSTADHNQVETGAIPNNIIMIPGSTADHNQVETGDIPNNTIMVPSPTSDHNQVETGVVSNNTIIIPGSTSDHSQSDTGAKNVGKDHGLNIPSAKESNLLTTLYDPDQIETGTIIPNTSVDKEMDDPMVVVSTPAVATNNRSDGEEHDQGFKSEELRSGGGNNIITLPKLENPPESELSNGSLPNEQTIISRIIPTEFFHLSGRTTIWSKGWEFIKLSPWIGYGFQADRLILGTHMHNSVMHALIQSGIIGTSALLSAVLYAWILLLKAIRRINDFSDRHRNLIIQSAAIMVFFSVRSITESPGAFYGIDWILLAPYLFYIHGLKQIHGTEQD